ncbi:MAG: hypothetical protein ACM34K_09980 [Bacillota bacterium]
MIYDQKTGERLEIMPHQKEFDMWLLSISRPELKIITDHINTLAGLSESIKLKDLGSPGKWAGTPFEPVYLKACFMDEKLSRLFAELILWNVIQNRPDEWYYESLQSEESTLTEKLYFRKII